MASSKTCVWIQGSVLSKALGGISSGGENGDKTTKKTVSDIDLDRSGGIWSWTKCYVKSGDYISVMKDPGTSLEIDIVDAESEYNSKSTSITHEVLKQTEKTSAVRTTPPIVMANEWASAEGAGGSNAAGLGIPPDDLITLTHLHEPSVVFCLKRRYEKDLIYTSTGPILIALNPFKDMPGLYDDSVMNDYWLAGEELQSNDRNKNLLDLKPHIYSNAHKAFRSMMQGIEMKMSLGRGSKSTENGTPSDIVIDQSMLVSGESGAGKTVTTKHVMKYLATLSQRKAAHAMRRRAASPGRSGDSGRLQRQMSQRGVVSSKRKSRAQSWKVGAQVEEKSKLNRKRMKSMILANEFGQQDTVVGVCWRKFVFPLYLTLKFRFVTSDTIHSP